MRRILVVIVAALAGAAAMAQECETACNQLIRGTRCTRLEFDGVAGQEIRAVVYPSFIGSTPNLKLVPPQSLPDGAQAPPRFTGGAGGAVVYTLPSSGRWTLDLDAPGVYDVALSCHTATYTDVFHDCLEQFVLCGQTVEWTLTPRSCRFSDNSDRVFVPFLFYGNAGDVLSAELESTDFTPRIGIYDGLRPGFPIGVSQSITPTKDSILFTLPATGLYDITITSRRDSALRFGGFKLTVHSCPT